MRYAEDVGVGQSGVRRSNVKHSISNQWPESFGIPASFFSVDFLLQMSYAGGVEIMPRIALYCFVE